VATTGACVNDYLVGAKIGGEGGGGPTKFVSNEISKFEKFYTTATQENTFVEARQPH
jgi:hypothetical protein